MLQQLWGSIQYIKDLTELQATFCTLQCKHATTEKCDSVSVTMFEDKPVVLLRKHNRVFDDEK